MENKYQEQEETRKAKNKFYSNLKALYGFKTKESRDIYIQAIVDLEFINTDEVNKVWKKLRDNFPRMPKPSQMRDALSEVRSNRASADKENDFKLNFGAKSNGHLCECREHHGIGDLIPEQRAKTYAWNRKTNISYDSLKREYLESYEKAHGKVNC